MHDEDQTKEPPVTEADECGVLPSHIEITAQGLVNLLHINLIMRLEPA